MPPPQAGVVDDGLFTQVTLAGPNLTEGPEFVQNSSTGPYDMSFYGLGCALNEILAGEAPKARLNFGGHLMNFGQIGFFSRLLGNLRHAHMSTMGLQPTLGMRLSSLPSQITLSINPGPRVTGRAPKLCRRCSTLK